MSITPHPSYEFGFVDGLFVKAVADRGPQEDEDRRPDFIPATDVGVKFTPVVSARKIVDAPSMYVTKTPTAAIVAQDGRLRLRGQESEPPGIGLIAGVYNVTFTGVPLAPIQIEVLPTHTEQNPLDLITVLPYEPAPNEVVHLVALPPGGEPGQVYGWTGSGIGWYTPEQAKGIASIEDSDGDGIATVTYTDTTTSALPLPAGHDGASAYDLWLADGNTGTLQDFLLDVPPHTHDDRYYTEGEVNTALAGKANMSHTHDVTDLTATGTPDGTTFLRGDGAWATPEDGGGSMVAAPGTVSTPPRMKGKFYNLSTGTASNSGTLEYQRLYLSLMFLAHDEVYDALGITTTVTDTGGAQLQFGIYSIDRSGVCTLEASTNPSTLVAANNYIQTLTSDYQPPVSGPYFLAMMSLGGMGDGGARFYVSAEGGAMEDAMAWAVMSGSNTPGYRMLNSPAWTGVFDPASSLPTTFSVFDDTVPGHNRGSDIFSHAVRVKA